MTLRHTTRFTVEFGDCDPAQIVFYPNFLKWMDSAARHLFVAAGVPPWSDLEAQTGIIGTPLVEVSARFVRPATYGDEIAVESWIDEWRAQELRDEAHRAARRRRAGRGPGDRACSRGGIATIRADRSDRGTGRHSPFAED